MAKIEPPSIAAERTFDAAPIDSFAIQQLLMNSRNVLSVVRTQSCEYMHDQIDALLEETERTIAKLKAFNRESI
jgi:hypothetical protein